MELEIAIGKSQRHFEMVHGFQQAMELMTPEGIILINFGDCGAKLCRKPAMIFCECFVCVIVQICQIDELRKVLMYGIQLWWLVEGFSHEASRVHWSPSVLSKIRQC